MVHEKMTWTLRVDIRIHFFLSVLGVDANLSRALMNQSSHFEVPPFLPLLNSPPLHTEPQNHSLVQKISRDCGIYPDFFNMHKE